MKKPLPFLVFILLSRTLSAQYIHQIKADSVRIHNDSCKAELILENSTKQINGFLYNKGNGRTEFRRMFTRSGDSLLFADGNVVQLNANSILNQYTQKQNASAWIDTLKGRNITSDSLFQLVNSNSNKIAVDFSPSKSNLNINEYYHKDLGLNNPSGNYGYNVGPLMSIKLTGDSLSKIRRNNALYASTSIEDTGTTAWGRNVIWTEPTSRFLKYYHIVSPPGTATIDLRSDMWYTNSALKSEWIVGLKNARADADTLILKTGTGWNATSNHFLYTDVNNGPVYKHIGWIVNTNSYFQTSSKAGSIMDTYVDYFGGAIHGGTANSIQNTYTFYSDDYGIDKIQRPWGVYIKGATRRNYFAGQILIGDTSTLNADVHKLYVNGSSKFGGNIVQTNGRMMLGGVVDDGITALQVPEINLTNGLLRKGSTIIGKFLDGSTYFTGIGYGAAPNSPQSSTVIGHLAANAVSGSNIRLTAVGAFSFLYLTSGIRNIGIGHAAGMSTSTGYDNTFLGTSSGRSITTGYANTLVGALSGSPESTSGANMSNSTIVGAYTMAGTLNNSTIDSVIIIGTGSTKTTNGGTFKNTTIIGNGINTDKSNVIIVGRADQKPIFSGNLLNLLGNFTPASSTDSAGDVGDISKDENYIYVKTSTGWKRAALSTF